MGAENRPVARRHHTVPRFYLRGFAEQERIATVRLPGDQRSAQSINDASVAKDFYAVAGHEDSDDVIEKSLSDVEGGTAEVFRTIANGTWPLSFDDRMSSDTSSRCRQPECQFSAGRWTTSPDSCSASRLGHAASQDFVGGLSSRVVR